MCTEKCINTNIKCTYFNEGNRGFYLVEKKFFLAVLLKSGF